MSWKTMLVRMGSRNRVVSEKDDLEKEVDEGRVGAEDPEWRSGGWWVRRGVRWMIWRKKSMRVGWETRIWNRDPEGGG